MNNNKHNNIIIQADKKTAVKSKPKPNRLGRNIKRYREAANLTKYRLGQLSGVSSQKIGQLEIGRHKDLFSANALKLAEALGVTVEQLHTNTKAVK